MVIAGSDGDLSVADLAGKLGIDRAIAYRIVATLEVNGLVSRGANGRIRLGAGVVKLEKQFLTQLRHLAQKHLDALAAEADATSFLSVADPATAPTDRAEKPMPFTAHVAGRRVEIDGIAFRLPFPALIPVAIVQDHAPRL